MHAKQIANTFKLYSIRHGFLMRVNLLLFKGKSLIIAEVEFYREGFRGDTSYGKSPNIFRLYINVCIILIIYFSNATLMVNILNYQKVL